MTAVNDFVQEILDTATNYPLIPGAVYTFENLLGSLYSIVIEDVTDTEVRLRNTREGSMVLTLDHKSAYALLEECAFVNPLKSLED